MNFDFLESVPDTAGTELPGFLNEPLDITVDPMEQTDSPDVSGEYYGLSSAALDIKIEKATHDLAFAKEQLDRAIERGGGVMTAMSLVESAQKLLDTYVEQQGKAAMAEAADTMSAKAGNVEEPRLGSVSHAEWELEQAYKSGNSIRIHNAEQKLAHEKAKEKSKQMG